MDNAAAVMKCLLFVRLCWYFTRSLMSKEPCGEVWHYATCAKMSRLYGNSTKSLIFLTWFVGLRWR